MKPPYIETAYHGPTNSTGARISVTDHEGRRTYHPYPYELSGLDCHLWAYLQRFPNPGDWMPEGWDRLGAGLFPPVMVPTERGYRWYFFNYADSVPTRILKLREVRV